MDENLTDEDIVELSEDEAEPLLMEVQKLFRGKRASTVAITLAWSVAEFAYAMRSASTPIESVTQIMREALRVMEEKGVHLDATEENTDESGRANRPAH
jgi:hypothetical protein